MPLVESGFRVGEGDPQGQFRALRRRARYFRRCVAAIVILFALATSAQADVLTATWNFNPEPDVTGYLISYGIVSGGPYTTHLDVGNVGTSPITVAPGFLYFFVIRAYNVA